MPEKATCRVWVSKTNVRLLPTTSQLSSALCLGGAYRKFFFARFGAGAGGVVKEKGQRKIVALWCVYTARHRD